MTTLEIILSIVLVVVSGLSIYLIYYYNSSYWDAMHLWHEQRRTIKKITEEGRFNALLDVDHFNEWFNRDKDKSIYAHPGIFLRVDKLDQGHIEDFIRMESKGIANIEHFKYEDIVDFEKRITKDWFKKQEER
jgi:hypothetical protein